MSDTDEPTAMWGNTKMTCTEMQAYVREIVDAAPPLGKGQRAKLAELLRPIREAGLITRSDVALVG